MPAGTASSLEGLFSVDQCQAQIGNSHKKGQHAMSLALGSYITDSANDEDGIGVTARGTEFPSAPSLYSLYLLTANLTHTKCQHCVHLPSGSSVCHGATSCEACEVGRARTQELQIAWTASLEPPRT